MRRSAGRMGCRHGSVGFRVAERHGWRRAGARATGAASGYGKAHAMATRTPTQAAWRGAPRNQGYPRSRRTQTHTDTSGHMRTHTAGPDGANTAWPGVTPRRNNNPIVHPRHFAAQEACTACNTISVQFFTHIV
ncbi:hypothetical protein DA2_0158 [Desulfovibrio sp. A2]|nr:hypothetical protein DA2_0158 [Desulfovibrio sp. A2]